MAVRFGNGDASAAALENMLNDISPTFSMEYSKLKEIFAGIKALEITRIEMRLVDKRMKYN